MASKSQSVCYPAWAYDALSSPGPPVLGRTGVDLPADPHVSATAALSAPLGSGRVTKMTGQYGTVDYDYDPTS